MRDEVRGAIVIAVLVTLYSGGVYLRRATRKPFDASVTQALGKEASEILRSEAIALVSEGDEGVEVWPRGGTRSVRFADRAALVRWLCSEDAPRETAVVILRGLPLGRGRLDQASAQGRLVVQELGRESMQLGCSTGARFYRMEVRSDDAPERP